MNLVQELGEGYMLERFAQTMFLFNNRTCFIDPGRRAAAAGLPVVFVDGTTEQLKVEKSNLPYDFFKDMNVFKLPDLGWRMANQGRYLVHFRRNNRMNQTHYKRGVTPKNLERFVAPSTVFLQENDSLSWDYYEKPEVEALLITKPEYIPFKQGIERMSAGDIFSFCVSPIVAVIPDVNESQAIYFNTRQVAKVDKKGKISCDNPVVDRYLRETL